MNELLLVLHSCVPELYPSDPHTTTPGLSSMCVWSSSPRGRSPMRAPEKVPKEGSSMSTALLSISMLPVTHTVPASFIFLLLSIWRSQGINLGPIIVPSAGLYSPLEHVWFPPATASSCHA